MWEEILSLAVGNGLWAVLFCALLFYELKDSRKRESKYVETIDALDNKLGIVNDIKNDTEEIISLCKNGAGKRSRGSFSAREKCKSAVLAAGAENDV